MMIAVAAWILRVDKKMPKYVSKMCHFMYKFECASVQFNCNVDNCIQCWDYFVVQNVSCH